MCNKSFFAFSINLYYNLCINLKLLRCVIYLSIKILVSRSDINFVVCTLVHKFRLYKIIHIDLESISVIAQVIYISRTNYVFH